VGSRHHRCVWRALAGSLAVHAVLLVLLMARTRPPEPPSTSPIEIELIDPPPPPPPTSGGGGGGGTSESKPLARATATHRAHRALLQLEVHIEAVGAGRGDGIGRGMGRGFGDGESGGPEGDVIAARDLIPPPPPPPPPPESRARAARLVFPTREGTADELFSALVTVDEDGDVVGVHMVKTSPGSRGEVAAAAIWRFRYAPALDASGKPVRSTFEQPFGLH
jgi:hypothetical protein